MSLFLYIIILSCCKLSIFALYLGIHRLLLYILLYMRYGHFSTHDIYISVLKYFEHTFFATLIRNLIFSNISSTLLYY